MPETTGKLYLVATPIGNLEDLTFRALRILREVDLIAAEDTRHTSRLLGHYEIKTPLKSCHAFNEHRRVGELLDRVEAGESVALVSDAGTPAVSDPGFLLVREALQREIEPEVIPGASAVTFAVTAAGLPVDKFAFLGFPPVKSGRRSKFLQKIAGEDKTVIIFESPHRMGKLIPEIRDEIGPDTNIAVVREATKVHQEVIRGTAGELSESLKDRKWKGECTVVIGRTG